MGIREQLKSGQITKTQARTQIKKWLQEQPEHSEGLKALERWVKAYKRKKHLQ